MKRAGFTLIELLVVVAIIAVLIGLLLPAVQKVRSAVDRLVCENNLKQLGLACHGYHDVNNQFPPGASQSPSQASLQVFILPYIEQANRFEQFDLSVSAYASQENYQGRIAQIPVLLCPADPSSGAVLDAAPPSGTTPESNGRSNYYGNAGTHGMWISPMGAFRRPITSNGVFWHNSATKLSNIRDGTSTTVLLAEIKRGSAPNNDELNVSRMSFFGWGSPGTNPATNPNNFSPPGGCNNAPTSFNLTGLQYYRGIPTATQYTHTIPPNYTGRDCISFLGDQFHLAARSYHHRGVNVVLVDGSVQFIADTISLDAWKAMGTSAGRD